MARSTLAKSRGAPGRLECALPCAAEATIADAWGAATGDGGGNDSAATAVTQATTRKAPLKTTDHLPSAALDFGPFDSAKGGPPFGIRT